MCYVVHLFLTGFFFVCRSSDRPHARVWGSLAGRIVPCTACSVQVSQRLEFLVSNTKSDHYNSWSAYTAIGSSNFFPVCLALSLARPVCVYPSWLANFGTGVNYWIFLCCAVINGRVKSMYCRLFEWKIVY